MEIDHFVQIEILRRLLFNPHAKFSELNTTGLTNDHFSFHLRKLLREGFIKKHNELYSLTVKGMEIAGRIDTEKSVLYRQPKLSISVCPIKKTRDGIYILLGKRKKAQSFGKVNFFTEKMRFGESMYETTERCLLRETGLVVRKENIEFAGVIHIIRIEDKETEIDVVLNCFRVSKTEGELVVETEENSNFWIKYEEALLLENTVQNFQIQLNKLVNGEIFFDEYLP